MRVTSDLWVSALVRRVFSGGGFAAIVRRGSTEAGAIFITSRDRMGQVALYGPAPQASYDTGRPEERFFVKLSDADQEQADKKLEREMRFDPDVWIVEIETSNVADLIATVES